MENKVTALTVEPQTPEPLANPDLRFRVTFTHPNLGWFSLPFETREQAQAVFDHVKANGTLPLIHDGRIIPVKPVSILRDDSIPPFKCRLCPTRIHHDGICPDCENNAQAESL